MDISLADPLVGTVLEGRYRVDAVLARGGMSTVYVGTDQRLDRVVAIKVMAPALAESPAFVEKFTREARSVARLSHPNVVSVYDQGADAGHVFLVMELVRGHTLRDLLRPGSLAPALALSVMESVLSALAAAHRAGLVHRDVKPENVLISADGAVKVADFGLARAIAQASATTQTGIMMGTVAYVAPEQVARGAADARSDVYAAGIMLYELLTGTPPYAGDTAISVAYRHVHDDVPPPSQLNPAVPPPLDELVVRATRREPGARPADAGAFLAELYDVRADLGLLRVPVPAYHDSAPMSVPRAGWDQTTAELGTAPQDRLSRDRPPREHLPPSHVPSLRPGPTPPVYTEQRDHRRRHRTGLVVMLLLGLVAAGGGWWLGAGRWVTVPQLAGLSRAQAVTVAQGAGARVVVGDDVFDESAAPGTVARTSPPIGHRMIRGGTLTIYLSKGPAPRVVPDVANLTRDDALGTLRDLGLTTTLATTYDENIERGRAVRTAPPAQAQVTRDARVTLYLSAGPAPRVVPEVGGRSVDDATAALAAVRLRAGTQAERFSDTVPAGMVISTSPAAGRRVARDAVIGLVVSKGPDLVRVPRVIGLSVDEARTKLAAAGFKVEVRSLFGGIGSVIGQSPGPFAKAKRGSTVTIGVL
ncbi:MAG TPA: Stk1 family PASTA domain-containing Ser/Thr kinase [Mycobacteriales bacterium]|nr:Stk1 family PASTA domain-containing Ser/Thr kinase [Mycobacteriales bacterium]